MAKRVSCLEPMAAGEGVCGPCQAGVMFCLPLNLLAGSTGAAMGVTALNLKALVFPSLISSVFYQVNSCYSSNLTLQAISSEDLFLSPWLKKQ